MTRTAEIGVQKAANKQKGFIVHSHHSQKQPRGNPRLGNTSRDHPRQNDESETTHHQPYKETAPRIEKLRQLQHWGAHQAALKTFYTSMIRPILEIGYHLTHDHKPSLEALQKVQNKCLRMITWTSPHESSKPSHEILQLPYIQSYLEQCRTKALKIYEDSELQQHLSEVLEAV